MISVLLTISIISYVLAVVFTSQRFASSPRWGLRRIQLTSMVAVAAHVLSVALVLNQTGYRQFTMASTLLIIAALLAVLNLSRGQRPEAILLRPVIFSFAVLSALVALFVPLEAGTISVSPGVTLHVALSLLAFSLLTLAALYSLQLLYINNLLKNHKAKALSSNLPPLMTVEGYFFRLLTVGTGVLTLAIVSGFIFLDNMFAAGQLHKTILSITAWLTFNCIIIIHYWRGLRGKPAVIFTLVASFLLILAYYGSRFVRDVILA